MRALPLALALGWTVSALPAPAFTVAIDPGHGGEKHGATGPGGVLEKDLALSIARRLAEKVEKELGGRAILVRDGDSDVDLRARVAAANAAGADLFLSIHMNSMPTERARRGTHGVETYFLSADASDAAARAVAERENADAAPQARAASGALAAILHDLAQTEAHHDSALLAAHVHERLVALTGAQDRGVMQAPFTVLMGAEMPAILCEVGFISHPREGRALATPARQELIARALARGIADFRKKIARRAANGNASGFRTGAGAAAGR